MSHAPCGCDLERCAASELDPAAAQTLEDAAPAAQDAWRCPNAGHGSLDASDLDENHREALVAVGRLTGFRDAQTCPLWYARLPWVRRATEAWEWREKGCLDAIESPLTGAMRDAINAVRDGVNARQAYDLEQSRKPKRPAKDE